MAAGHPAGQPCPECGSSSVVEDDLYSQPQWVCADCGSVVAEGRLTTDRSEELQGTNVQYYESTAVDKQPCRNQIRGLKRVRALCRILRFPAVIEQAAESLFSRAYNHPAFLHAHQPKKEALAGCSALLACRLHGWPVVMGTVVSLLEVDPCLAATVYQELVKKLNVEPPTLGITDLLEEHCASYCLSVSDVPEEYCETPGKLAKRASALLELAAETWLVTGRHPVPLLVASVYLAWLSLKPCVARMRLSLARFGKMAKVDVPKPASKRLAELKEVLCKLGKELPWQQGAEVEPQKVAALIEDILKHRLTLLRLALQSHEESLTAELVPANEDVSTGPTACPENLPAGHTSTTDGQPSGVVNNTMVLSSDHTHRAEHPSSNSAPHAEAPPLSDQTRNSAPPGGPNPQVERALDTLDKEAEHGWKRLPFVPPCMKKPSKRARRTARGPEVTGYEEISDSEIESYLRTPQEVRELTETQAKVWCNYQPPSDRV
ncbi:transcription factor IIIB 50 kDa subunit-like [Arapaima gigas]